MGGLDDRSTERDLEDEFSKFGPLNNVWVARRPPGFAFIEYGDPRDAEDAVRDLDGHRGWRVEFSRSRGSRGGGREGGRDDRGRGMHTGTLCMSRIVEEEESRASGDEQPLLGSSTLN